MTRNTITYTTQGSENQAVLDRPRALTVAGAQRIIRREHPTAIVSRVEAFSYRDWADR